GSFILLREVTLEETSGDGLFTPGENVKLRLVLDNYGLEASRLEQVRLRMIGGVGGGTARINLRTLPALAAYTRTTLTVVVSSPITGQYVGQKLTLLGVLEVQKGESWVAISNVAPNAEIHYPLELADVTLPHNPKIDETITGNLHFINRTKNKLGATKFKV